MKMAKVVANLILMTGLISAKQVFATNIRGNRVMNKVTETRK